MRSMQRYGALWMHATLILNGPEELSKTTIRCQSQRMEGSIERAEYQAWIGLIWVTRMPKGTILYSIDSFDFDLSDDLGSIVMAVFASNSFYLIPRFENKNRQASISL